MKRMYAILALGFALNSGAAVHAQPTPSETAAATASTGSADGCTLRYVLHGDAQAAQSLKKTDVIGPHVPRDFCHEAPQRQVFVTVSRFAQGTCYAAVGAVPLGSDDIYPAKIFAALAAPKDASHPADTADTCLAAIEQATLSWFPAQAGQGIKPEKPAE